jgi:hypothetical protein
MSSPSDSCPKDLRTERRLKRSRKNPSLMSRAASGTAAYAELSPATNIADLALLNRYQDNWEKMIDGEHGSRVGDKSKGGSRGVDKREEPSATATEIGETPSTKHKESGLSSCYCSFNTFIKEHNKTKGFVTNDDLDSSIWATVQGIFPNYFPLTGSTKEVKIALAEFRKHSPFVYKVAKHFSFLTDTTKNILCNEDNDLSFRVAVAERLGICIFLLIRLTTTINSNKKDNDDKSKGGLEVVEEISAAEGVVNKGMAYLESVLKCIKESSEPKWSDYFGSVHAEECVKRCFGIFLLLKYKVKDHSNVADAGKL